jgi:hypothetical protein
LFADAVARGEARGTNQGLCGYCGINSMEAAMGFGRGALLWMLGIPLPIILILALFMR